MRYVIHIGYGKTGTTTIQNVLARNRDRLLERGVLYPDIRHKGTWLRLVDHNFLGLALSGDTRWVGLQPADYLDQFHRQLAKAHGANTVLLSAESFAGGVHPWDFDSAEEYNAAVEAKIRQLRELLSSHEVRILVYLRRQDLYLESAIDQTIKNESFIGRQIFKSVPNFLELMHPRLDYATVLDAWAETFGRKNIEVGVFEKAQFRNGSLIYDFLYRLGIEFPQGLQVPSPTAGVANPRLVRDVAEFKRILNLIPKPRHEERLIMNALQEISVEMEHLGCRKSDFLSPHERRDLLTRYELGNRYVARTYLNREDGELFRQPLPDPAADQSPYPGLPVEKAVEIMLRLQRKVDSPRGRIERFRLWAGKILRETIPFVHALARPLNKLYLKRLARER